MRKLSTKQLVIQGLSMLVILALLAACSSKGDGASKGASNSPATESSIAPTVSPAVPANKQQVELTLFIDHSWYPIKEWKGSIADKITEKTGVKLKVTVASDDKQLPIMIASGDLPDLVFTSNQISRLSNPGLSYSWNDLIEKYAPDFVIDPIRKAVNAAPDGKFYTVRNSFATQQEWDANKFSLGSDGNPGVDIRSDLLKELGNPEIKTLDDFVSVLEKAKAKYPTMVPLTMDINWIEQYFKAQFGIDVGNQLYEVNGVLHYGITHPKMVDYYKFMNSLYKKGLILAENFAYSNDKIDDEYAASGKAFAHMHTVSIGDSDNSAAKKNGKPYTWQMLPTALTPETVLINAGIGFSGTIVTKNNKHPKESIKLLQYLASDEGKKLVMFGIEGKDWTMNPKGYPEFKYDPNDSDFTVKEGLKW